jgi:hypothetical protein
MVIDNEGLNEVNYKLKNGLESIYNKIDDAGHSGLVDEEFDFIYKLLGQMETEWSHDVTNVPSMPDELTIDGRIYARR